MSLEDCVYPLFLPVDGNHSNLLLQTKVQHRKSLWPYPQSNVHQCNPSSWRVRFYISQEKCETPFLNTECQMRRLKNSIKRSLCFYPRTLLALRKCRQQRKHWRSYSASSPAWGLSSSFALFWRLNNGSAVPSPSATLLRMVVWSSPTDSFVGRVFKNWITDSQNRTKILKVITAYLNAHSEAELTV